MIKADCLRDSRVYTHKKAAFMVKMCNYSYEKDGREITQENIIKDGFDTVNFLHGPIHDVQCFIAHNDHDIVIVFRGSESKLDWNTNFTGYQTDVSIGKVHAGFLKASMEIMPQIENVLRSIPYAPAKDLYVAGHSLGGAMTTVISICINEFLHVTSFWMYGSPRCYNPEAARAFNSIFENRTFRIVNNADIVARIPPRKMTRRMAKIFFKITKVKISKEQLAEQKKIRYAHINKLVYITARKKIRTNVTRVAMFFDRVFGKIKSPFDSLAMRKNRGYGSKTRWVDFVEDHHPAHYFNALAKAAKSAERLDIWEEYRS